MKYCSIYLIEVFLSVMKLIIREGNTRTNKNVEILHSVRTDPFTKSTVQSLCTFTKIISIIETEIRHDSLGRVDRTKRAVAMGAPGTDYSPGFV